MKKVLELSTSTVAGAAIMLVFNVLLGEKAPWFVERLHASAKNIFEISLNVNEIIDDSAKPEKIDMTQYHVDAVRKFYLRLPSRQWSVSVEDPGTPLTGLSVMDIPAFRHMMNALRLVIGERKPAKGELSTTSVRPPTTTQKISFLQESKYDGIPFNLKLVESEPPQAETWIRQNWPDEQEVRPAVSVTTIERKFLASGPVETAIYKGTKVSLFSSIASLQLLNPELTSFNVKRVDIAKNNKVLLIDATATLDNIVVNGNKVDRAELVKLFLVAEHRDLIYVVSMRYLHGPGIPRSMVQDLEGVFRSFRLLS